MSNNNFLTKLDRGYEGARKAFGYIQRFCLILGAACIGVFIFVILLQTFTRFVIFHSLPWSEEFSKYVFIVMLMFALNVCVSDNALIQIDAIDNIVKKGTRLRAVLDILRNLGGFVVCIAICIGCAELFRIGKIQKSPAMRIPMFWMYLVVFSGYLLAFIATVFRIIDAVYNLVTGKEKNAVTEVAK